jgi:uncharacterized protein
VPDLREGVLERLSAQARLQLEQLDSGGPLRFEIVDPAMLSMLPARSPGDIFFDFEGDPMWTERGDPTWGLEYLFGAIEVDGVAEGGEPTFRAFWAHDRVEERQALVDFIAYLADRRRRWPDLHVYHYAAYEPSALLRLAARHGVCEDDVDQLLRDGVFVDLYSVVRGGIRISDRSYSLKRVETLYRGERDKDGVSEGAASSLTTRRSQPATPGVSPRPRSGWRRSAATTRTTAARPTSSGSGCSRTRTCTG